MPLDLVVFDLDGTLVDSCPDIAAAVNHALASVGRPSLTEDVVRTFIGDGVRRLLERALGGADDAIVERARTAFLPYYEAHGADRTVLLSGAIEALDASPRAALLTNKPRKATEIVLRSLGIAERFVAVIAGDDALPRKPDPAPVRALMVEAGSSPASTLLVGDGPADVRAAQAAGVKVCAVLGGYGDASEIRALGPTFVVERLLDVPPIITRLRGSAVR